MDPEKIEMIGYTDDIGSTDYNLELSAKRAIAVQRYFEQKDVSLKGKIETQGKGRG